jgi:preprotein translocase subunit YajC
LLLYLLGFLSLLRYGSLFARQKERTKNVLNDSDMRTVLQKGQQVLTPEGLGTVDEIIGEEITVKLDTGEKKAFSDEDLQDNSDAG